jgi:hypothetical protein
MAAVAQIVAGIDGAVLADLNGWDGASGAGTLLGARSRLDMAAVELARQQTDRAVVWSPTVEPEELASRSITVPLVVMTDDPADLPAQVARLNALVRKPFWLRVRRHGSSTTVHLRCWPTVPRWSATMTAAGAQGVAVGTLETQTDPYGYGPRIDIPPAEVQQDPSVAGAWVLDIDNVQGDSPTPICVSSTDQELLGNDHGLLIAVRRRGTPSALGPVVAQAETATLRPLGRNAPTMATFTMDPAFSGGGGVSINFAASGGADSLGQLTVPGSAFFAGPEAPGVYRLLVRARRSGGSAGLEHNVRAAVGPFTSDALFTASGSDTRVLDLGLVQVPIGQPTYYAAPHTSAGAVAPDITLLCWKTSTGAGRLDVDWLALVPADEGQGVSYGAAGGITAGYWWHLDGYDHTPRVFTGHPYAAGVYAAGQLPLAGLRFVGGVPKIGPGSNRLWFVGGLQLGAQGSWPPDKVINVQVSYWPRFGWLA